MKGVTLTQKIGYGIIHIMGALIGFRQNRAGSESCRTVMQIRSHVNTIEKTKHDMEELIKH